MKVKQQQDNSITVELTEVDRLYLGLIASRMEDRDNLQKIAVFLNNLTLNLEDKSNVFTNQSPKKVSVVKLKCVDYKLNNRKKAVSIVMDALRTSSKEQCEWIVDNLDNNNYTISVPLSDADAVCSALLECGIVMAAEY